MKEIKVLGAGLAGCEAAWQIANRGIKVKLIEMKPLKKTPAHKSDGFAELVCSNSLKAARIDSAAGLLKEEMRRFGSVCLDAAAECSVAAGGALAVDRDIFSSLITKKIKAHPNIEIENRIVTEIPDDGITVIATGPLTDGELAEKIKELSGGENLSFYDAAAPIVTAESIDMSKAFYASRYDKGTDDYINCYMNKEEYTSFHKELVNAESAPLKKFDKPLTVYEGCMPIEVLAKRGEDSIRFGPLKPVGLKDPRTGHRPWAAVQLRRENAEGTLFNIVGFQTNLKWGEQKRVFSMIPGLENAEFIKYGVMHRNTFINSPELLDEFYRMKKHDKIWFAGQITGVEGYVESASSGIMAGYNLAHVLMGKELVKPSEKTVSGALSLYISNASNTAFQPMNANFGIVAGLDYKVRKKQERYAKIAERALDEIKNLYEV